MDHLSSHETMDQMATEMDNTIYTLNPTETLKIINTTREGLEDLYTDPLIEYELFIIFQAIKESFSEITFLPELPKKFIFSFHPNVYKTPFVLQNPTPQTMHFKKKAAVVIILRAR